MLTIAEPSKQIPVVSDWDVIVCGAGPAGVAAASLAARNGARTCLIEAHGCLGGIWTSGSLSYILDGKNKTEGVLAEILARLDRLAARTGFVADVEATKWVLEQMCEQAGVHIRLHTRVSAAVRDERNKLAYVVTESKSGREAWSASVFIDATGDGDLSAHAGCEFGLGQEETGVMQPMSLVALVTGVAPEACVSYTKIERQSRHNLYADIEKGGFTPSYGNPGLWHIRDDLYIMMVNHQYGYSAVNAEHITKATVQARQEIHKVVEALRSLGGIWKDLRLVSTAAQIGVREGRRIKGRYEVTIDDMMSGTMHEDSICTVTFKVDVHALNPSESKSFASYNQHYRTKTKPYGIPLRAMIARDVDGLLMAGRCISGDFLAHSSYRVTGNAVQMGQAAGVLAAVAVRSGRLPHEVAWQEVKKVLERSSRVG